VKDEPVIEQTDPRRPEVRAALTQYLEEIKKRVPNMGVDPSEADDVDDYTAPGGVFLLAYRGDEVVGCGAVRTFAPGVGELKRMWVRPSDRGMGVGSRLLAALTAESRALGHSTLLLDTNNALTEALALYRKHGFEPIEPYHDNPDATDFLRKAL
jgi:ribosomal protein S18 acetylase RimI-like enzyme